MLVETADAGAVAMRIPRAEWAALREADIRTAVDSALETHGLAPWTSMKIELFSGMIPYSRTECHIF